MELYCKAAAKLEKLLGASEPPFTGFIHHYLHGLLARKNPVIVYQMGKVGSSSVSDSLKAYGLRPVYHIHKLNPSRNWYGKRVYRDIIKKQRKVDFITLVRDPIARNISSFGWKIGSQSQYSVDWYVERFPLYHREEDRPLKWFDTELKPVTGIDVFDYPFPKEKGWQVIQHDNFRLLILKLEKPDQVLEKAVIHYLDLNNDFILRRTNITRKKTGLYQQFKRKVDIPEWYMNKMLKSKYCQHFYSEKEIAGMRAKYNVSHNTGWDR